jgi:hypothetical protein
MFGDCEQERANQENVVLGAGLRALSNPDVAAEVYDQAKTYVSNNKSYVGGRFLSGGLTTAGLRGNLYMGATLTTFAGMGDALYAIENGVDTNSDIVTAMLGESFPNSSRKKSCGCQ